MIIIHGEDQIASRQAYLDIKAEAEKAGLQVNMLAGDALTLDELINASRSISLLGEDPAVFVENFFSRRQSREKKQIFDYILGVSPQAAISFWEARDVTGQLKDFPQSTVRRFDLPKYIFEFLDTLSLDSYHRAVKVMPAEQILASLATRLLKVQMGTGRLRGRVSADQLSIMLKRLLEIDFRQKTSNSAMDLAEALELWVVENIH